MAPAGFLDIERTTAPPGFDRWRVPAAAIAVHLALGQALGLGVFYEPLSRLVGVSASAAGDWSLDTLGWIVPVTTIFLGISAFAFGRWVDDAGPRRAMLASASCFVSGLVVAALGVQLHQLWLVFLGTSVLGGIGLGIGYLAPLPTLISWFPDRPALATGLAITGFGAGALLGATLAESSMRFFAGANVSGVVESLIVMASVSFLLMLFGIITVRVPAVGWKPRSFTSRAIVEPDSGPIAPRVGSLAGRSVGERKEAAPDVRVERAMHTPQFWLLWVLLFCNTAATLGIFALAAPMIRDFFPFTVAAREAAGFIALLAIADAIGRLAWAVSSEAIGRWRTIAISLALATLLMALIPAFATMGTFIPFVVASALVVSVNGGIFSTLLAALRDTFGVMHIGAIQGRLLSAWSAAAIVGPPLATWLHEREIGLGATRVQGYAMPMYAMAGVLALAFVANWLIFPVHPRHHDKPLSGFRG